MPKVELEVSCCLCTDSSTTPIELPEGWGFAHGYQYMDNGFCPKHASVIPFEASQCPGCVEGWSECGLWRSFAFGDKTITEQDLKTIERGICPKRTNGTIVMTGKFEDIDLSEPASIESGRAFAQAIRDYINLHGRD